MFMLMTRLAFTKFAHEQVLELLYHSCVLITKIERHALATAWVFLSLKSVENS